MTNHMNRDTPYPNEASGTENLPGLLQQVREPLLIIFLSISHPSLRMRRNNRGRGAASKYDQTGGSNLTQELVRKRPFTSEGVRTSEAKVPWHGLALAAILILSAFLNLFRLTNEGYGILYYSAAVKNMLTSWHNFFFVSF